MSQAPPSIAIHPQANGICQDQSTGPLAGLPQGKLPLSSVAQAKFGPNQPKTKPYISLNRVVPPMYIMSQPPPSIAIHPQAKWNMPAGIISSMDRATHQEVPLVPARLRQICQNPVSQPGGIRHRREGSHHAGCGPALSIQPHTPTSQMEHASSNHQVHGQS